MTEPTDLAKNEITQNMITSPPSSYMRSKNIDSSDSESDEALNQDTHRYRKRMLPSQYLRTSDTDINIALVSQSHDDLARIQYSPKTLKFKQTLAKNLEFHAEELTKLYSLDNHKTDISSEMFLPTGSQIGKKTQFNKIEGNKSNSLGRETRSKNNDHLWDRQWNRWWGWNWSRKKNIARRHKHSQDGSLINLKNELQRLKGGGGHHKIKINPKRIKNDMNYHRKIIVKNIGNPKQPSTKNWEQLKHIYDTPCNSVEVPNRKKLINQEPVERRQCENLACTKRKKRSKPVCIHPPILKQEKHFCKCNLQHIHQKPRPQLKLVNVKSNKCEQKFVTKPKVFCNNTCKRCIELENCNRNESYSESFVCPKKNKFYQIETVSEYSSNESYIFVNAPNSKRRSCSSHFDLSYDNYSNGKDICSCQGYLKSSTENEEYVIDLEPNRVYCNQKCRLEVSSSSSNSPTSICNSLSERNFSKIPLQKCRCKQYQKSIHRRCNCCSYRSDKYRKTIPCKEITFDISSTEHCQQKPIKRKRIVDCDCLVRPIKRSKILDASKKSLWQVLDNNGSKLPIGFIFQKSCHNKEKIDPWIQLKTWKKYTVSQQIKNSKKNKFLTKSIECQYDIKDTNINNPLTNLSYTAAYQVTSYPFLIGEKTFVCPQSGRVIHLKSKFNSFFTEKINPNFNSVGSLYRTNKIYTNYATNNSFTNLIKNDLISKTDKNFSYDSFKLNENLGILNNNKPSYKCTDEFRNYNTEKKNFSPKSKINQSSQTLQKPQTDLKFPDSGEYSYTEVEIPNPGTSNSDNQQPINNASNNDELNSLLTYTECLLSQSKNIHNNLNNMFNFNLPSMNKNNESLHRTNSRSQIFDPYKNTNRSYNQSPYHLAETVTETYNYSNDNLNQEISTPNNFHFGTNLTSSNNEQNQKHDNYDLNFIRHNLPSFMNRISDTDILNRSFENKP